VCEQDLKKQEPFYGHCKYSLLLDWSIQEEYTALKEAYMRNCSAVIIMYSIADKSSLDYVHDYVKDLEKNKDTSIFNIPCYLVGNKCDIDGDSKNDNTTGSNDRKPKPTRQVSYEEGMIVALQYGMKFGEISVKQNLQVDTVVLDLVLMDLQLEVHKEFLLNNNKKQQGTSLSSGNNQCSVM